MARGADLAFEIRGFSPSYNRALRPDGRRKKSISIGPTRTSIESHSSNAMRRGFIKPPCLTGLNQTHR